MKKESSDAALGFVWLNAGMTHFLSGYFQNNKYPLSHFPFLKKKKKIKKLG